MKLHFTDFTFAFKVVSELLEFGLPLLPQACVSELGISQRVRVGLSFYAGSPQGFCLKSSTVNIA